MLGHRDREYGRLTAMRAHAALRPAAARLIDGLEALTAETGREAAEAIFDEIPAYHASHGAPFFADVCHHVELNIEALVRSLRQGRPPSPEELVFLRAPTTRRAQRKIALDDFLHAFRIGFRHIWRSLVSGADDDESRVAALTLVDPVAEYINIASTRVAEVYVEVEQLLVAEGERVRRDALEDLLSAAGVRPGPRAEALAAAGLSTGSTFLVVSALPEVDTDASHAPSVGRGDRPGDGPNLRASGDPARRRDRRGAAREAHCGRRDGERPAISPGTA